MFNVVPESISSLDGYMIVGEGEKSNPEIRIKVSYPYKMDLEYVQWLCEAINEKLEKDEQEERKIQDYLDNELMDGE